MDNNQKKYILVTGATGQLGSDIVSELKKRNLDVIGVGSSDLDITDESAVKKFFSENNFSHVIHSAAYTKVDLAETEKELNYKINVIGTRNIVNECKKYDVPLTYFSTDYVFGGEGTEPHKVDDKVNPLCEYAKAKLEGEKCVRELKKYFIIRISWIYGKNGSNFVKTMLKLSETRTELKVVADQIGSPTYTIDIAKVVADIIDKDKYGTYHVTNEGYVSWADFAREIFKIKDKKVNVIDTTTEEYAATANRPKNSRLDKSKLYELGFDKMPDWRDALMRFLKEI